MTPDPAIRALVEGAFNPAEASLPTQAPDCEHCRDSGFVLAGDGVTYLPCKCQPARVRELRHHLSGVPSALAEARLNTLNKLGPPTPAILSAALHASRELQAGRLPCLLLMGSVGTGKSHIAAALVNEAIDRDFRAYFASWQGVLFKVKSSFDKSSSVTQGDIMTPLTTSQLIALDDIAKPQQTEWSDGMLGWLIEETYRKRGQRGLIITTNHIDDPQELVDRGLAKPAQRPELEQLHAKNNGVTLEERIGEWLRSRLHEQCKTFVVTGKDRRKV